MKKTRKQKKKWKREKEKAKSINWNESKAKQKWYGVRKCIDKKGNKKGRTCTAIGDKAKYWLNETKKEQKQKTGN